MNRGGKRQANSPVGASFKDPRRENQNTQSNRFDALGDYESDGGGSWTDVTNRNQPNNLIYRLTDQHLQVWQPKDHEEQVRAKMLGARNNNNQKKYWTGFSKRPPLMDL